MVYSVRMRHIDNDADTFVWISEFDDVDVLPEGLTDEDIFFYGLSREAAQRAADSGEPYELEWYILEVGTEY